MLTKPLQIIEGYGKLAATELGLLANSPKGAERFAKCVQCVAFSNGVCTLCNCYMPAKVLVSTAFCPKGLW